MPFLGHESANFSTGVQIGPGSLAIAGAILINGALSVTEPLWVPAP